jgi:hypothetical protein
MLERRSPHRGFVAQPSRCVHCARPVTLHVLPTSGLHILSPPSAADVPAAEPREIVWRCPVCSKLNNVGINGRLALVTRGHPDPDPDWSPYQG